MKLEQLRLELRTAPEYKAPEPPSFHRDRLLLTLRTKMDKVIFDEGETRLIDNLILEGLVGVTGDNLYCLTSKGKFAVADILDRVATPSAEPVRMPKVDWSAVPDAPSVHPRTPLRTPPLGPALPKKSARTDYEPDDDIFNDDW